MLGGLAILTLVMIYLTRYFGNRFMIPIAELNRASGQLPTKIAEGATIEWREPSVKEELDLQENFRQMEHALQESFRELFIINENLEERVALRTAELQESRDRLNYYVDYSPMATVEWDANFVVTRWAGEAEKIFGWTKEEVFGKSIMDLHIIFDDDVQIVQDTMNALESGTKNYVISANRNYTKDGRVIHCEWYNAVMINQQGNMGSVLSQVLDVSERKQYETKLEQARNDAEAANIAKSEFLANMSHEIRTPMNGIIGMTGLLLDTQLNDEQRRQVEIVRASSESLLGLINDILDFSKIEAGKLNLELIDFNLQNLLDDFAATMAFDAQSKGLELLCTTDPGVPTLFFGDPNRLSQILTNLVGNAIKFTHHGEVSISVSLATQETHEDDSEVLLRFSVRDTGIGIAQDKLGFLFEKFTQVDASTTRQYGGSGLGLAISKQLAKLMGGEIGVESVKGQGSEFWFTARLTKQPERMQCEKLLPALAGQNALYPQSISMISAGDQQRLFAGNKQRILLVEDNTTNQKVALGILMKMGLHADVVADGVEALAVLAAIPYDLVLMDVQMPNMDGFEATRLIRDPHSAVLDHGIPIIAMTARAMQGDREKCLATGMNDYVTKPIIHQTLLEVLEKFLPQNMVSGEPIQAKNRVEDEQQVKNIELPLWDKALMLDRLMGDENLVRDISGAFIEDIPRQIRNLEKFLESGDITGVERQAHTIGGASANVSGERLRSVAIRMEQAARAGELKAASADLSELKEQFDRLRAEMIKEIP